MLDRLRSRLQAGLLSALVALAAAPALAAGLGDGTTSGATRGPSQGIDPQALLARSDAIRNPAGSFSVSVLLTEYRGGVAVDSAGLSVFSRPAADSGQYDNLVRYAEPARDAGKLLLHNGLDLWFFDPSSAASVRISPQARLLGQASNGDVMTVNLAKDYRATLTGLADAEDAGHAVHHCAMLHLIAERPDVPYAAADYWIDSASAMPVKIKFLTAENRLVKTAYFRRFQAVMGIDRPTETVILDGLNPSWITVMRLSDYAPREVPASWFQRDYLPRFTGG